MLDIIFKIWYLIVIFPILIFFEGTDRFDDFLKKRNIYTHWDVWHSLLVLLIVLFIILLLNGYRF